MEAGDSDHSGRAGPDIEVTPLDPAHGAVVASWRYEGPWSVYNPLDEAAPAAELGYRSIIDRSSGTFLGYVCTGQEARVPGLDAEEGVLDVGIGLDPAIVGRGRGASIVGPALDWVERTSGLSELRAVVQSWNARSLRLCARLGFEVSGHHVAHQDGTIVDYVVLRRRRTGA